jgi:ribokinase
MVPKTVTSAEAGKAVNHQVRVCVVGSVNMDLVVRAARLPSAGETILGGSYRTFPGGKGANQAVAAKRMGADVALIAAIGDDPHGREIHKTLEAEGIDLSHFLVRTGRSTGLAMITVAEGGENTIVVAPGANGTLTPEDVDPARSVIASCDVLLMQLETPLPTVVAAASIAREAGKPVILNAAPARGLTPELLELVDVLLVNRTEAALLAQMSPMIEPARLALRLAELGPPTVVLTLGSHGAIVAHRNRPRRVSACPVKAVDAVGAGDAFAGALAVCWPPVHAAARLKSPDEFSLLDKAFETAAGAGAAATTKHGAMPSLPTRAEVDAYVATLARA